MADKLPFQLTAGISNRGSTVHASDKTNTDLSRAHTEEDISRLQSAINAFDASFTYKVGDLVLQGGIERRCITAITTPAAFNAAEWTGIAVAGVNYPEGTPLDVTIGTADTLIAATSTLWLADSNNNGFALSTGPVTGLFTYNGDDDIVVILNYAAEIEANSQNVENFAGIFKNGTELTVARKGVEAAGSGNAVNIAGTLIIALSNGDTIQFGVGGSNTSDITVNSASLTLVRAT